MKKWRDASTVIIAARNNFPNFKQATPQCDYRILTAKRNVESSFMPNSHVFPGGTLDPEDSSQEWEKLHQNMTFSQLKLSDHISKLYSDKLDIFKTPTEEYLPRYLSLRIAAIRETFEECGILLCRRSGERSSGYGSFLVTDKVKEMQNQLRDREHPLQFQEICRQLQCFPDVWSLKEGRNWLTPSHLPKRFDTAFFIVSLDQTPPTLVDLHEMSEIKWSTPEELLQHHKAGSLWLPPPQLYEISKMARYSDLEALSRAASDGDFCSSRCFLPVIVPLSDGMVFVLPDDSCYEEATKNPDKFQDESVDSFRLLASHLCRHELPHDSSKVTFVETQGGVVVRTSDLISKM